MFKKFSSQAVFAGILMLAMSAPAWALDPPSAGLGQSWPNTVDVSRSPSLHAYVFMLRGVKYVQVNDINGNVLGAVGTANGDFITLPIGRFSNLVSTPQQPATDTTVATPVGTPTVVYQDTTTQITATPLSNGTMQLSASAVCDPIECSAHIQ
ncbi:MAG: hypothetical protein PF483_09270 [Halothiobacillus sp.]|jgi:hypothetical protein|nr:hypothetical protein [Halothiobacillus sp.]